MLWIGTHGASESGKDTAIDFLIKEFGGVKAPLAAPMKDFCEQVFSFSKETLWGPGHLRNLPDPRYDGATRIATVHIARVRYAEHADTWIATVLPKFTDEQRAGARQALDAWFEDCLAQPQVICRYVLQTLGTEWGRAQYPNIWLEHAERDVETTGETIAYVPDLRFLNEGEFMHVRKGVVIELLRPGADGQNAMAAGVAMHQSEMERIKQAAAFRQYITDTVHNDDTLEVFYDRLRTVVVMRLAEHDENLRGTGPLVRV
jgi:hypothetical protein